MNSLHKLIRESGATIATFVLILLLASTSSLLAALPPHFLGAAINSIVGTELSSQTSIFSPIHRLNEWLIWAVISFKATPVVLFLALFFLFNLIYLLVRNMFAVYVSIFADRFTLFVRQKCFAKILRGKKSDLERFESGDLVHRVMSDTMQLDSLIGTPLYTLGSDLLDLLWISAIIIMIDWKILLILVAIVPVLYVISRKTAALQRAYAVTIQRNEASCTGFIQCSVMGIDTVKVLSHIKGCKKFWTYRKNKLSLPPRLD
jgi:ABC-type multidrug transport system fused ATPase/permease subunit